MEGSFGQLGPALPMIAITLLLMVMFMTYQIGSARRRAKDALTRDRRRPRTRLRQEPVEDIDSRIEQLMQLRDRGRIDERTYYEVLRRLTSGDQR